VTTTVFDPAAAAYDRLRPGYPEAVYDAVEQLSGIALPGSMVVEVGAGTGIATRALRRRGARVLAIDLSLAMLRVQARPGSRPPGRAAARGERLPVRTGVADLVCSATAWHWVEAGAGVAEAVRVLRPGAALAVWWNTLAERAAAWVQEREESLRRRGATWTGCYAKDYTLTEFDDALRTTRAFASVERQDVRWERTVPIGDHLAELATHSPVIRLGDAVPAYLDEQRAVLVREFPDGMVRERYLCHLHVAKAPA
jgi:SAM-dependent methyltransferase